MSANQTATKTEKKLEYIVMPDLTEGSPPNGGFKNLMRGPSAPRRKIILIILAIAAGLAILGSLGYYFLTKPEPEAASPVPAIVVDSKTQESEDPDNDGLSNEDEAKHGTKTDNSDTDSDGLADGDEVYVYGSNPKLADTDGDSFNDGQEVARGFSPLLNTTEKADAAERQKWLTNSVSTGLHEPTGTTLKENAANEPEAAAAQTVYINSFYNYSIEYPSELFVREEGSGQILGISIAGSEPAEDIALEQFVIALGGTKEALTLKEWVETQYNTQDYQLETLTINHLPAVRIRGRAGDDGCGQDKTFFAKNNLIISVTWNCNSLAPLEPFYTGIINSFKFK